MMKPQPKRPRAPFNYHELSEQIRKNKHSAALRHFLVKNRLILPILLVVVVLGIMVTRCFTPKTVQPTPSSSSSELSSVEPTANTAVFAEAQPEISEARQIIDAAQSLEPGELIDVPLMDQGEYPTGCETISTMMMLRYYGIDISTEDFIDNYLPIANYEFIGDTMYAPSPNDYFIGDPRESYSYGCFAPVIEKALSKLLPDDCRVENLTGQDLSELAEEYISKSQPLLVWVSINMSPIEPGNEWILPTGETYVWPSGEHCVVLVGYDDQCYYFNDPLQAPDVVAYDKEIVEERFAEMYYQALAIVANDNELS